MPWPKGVPRKPEHIPKPGNRKGIPNKHTADIKAMIVQALNNKGGSEYLEHQADENPSAFLALVGKVLPMQVTGEGGGALIIRWEQPEKPAIEHEPFPAQLITDIAALTEDEG